MVIKLHMRKFLCNQPLMLTHNLFAVTNLVVQRSVNKSIVTHKNKKVSHCKQIIV